MSKASIWWKKPVAVGTDHSVACIRVEILRKEVFPLILMGFYFQNFLYYFSSRLELLADMECELKDQGNREHS